MLTLYNNILTLLYVMYEYKKNVKRKLIKSIFVIACVIITRNLTCRVGVKFLFDRLFIGVTVIEGENRSSEIVP